MKKLFFFLLIVLHIYAETHTGKAISRWKLKIPFIGQTGQGATTQFLFDSGSPRILSLTAYVFQKFGPNITILGKKITAVQSVREYANFNVIGTQFLTVTQCQILKEKGSDIITLSTSDLMRYPPAEAIYVTNLGPTDHPQFYVPEFGNITFDTGAPYQTICSPQTNNAICPLPTIHFPSNSSYNSITQIEGHLFCACLGCSRKVTNQPLVGASSRAWKDAQIAFKGFATYYEFWIKGPITTKL